MGNEMDQSALLAAAFGSKAGVALKNLLPDMEALIQEARRLGIVVDEKLLRGAAEMNDEFTRLGALLSVTVTNAVLAHKDEIIALTRAFINAIPQIALAVQNFAMWIGLLERPLDIQITNATLELEELKEALQRLMEGGTVESARASFILFQNTVDNADEGIELRAHWRPRPDITRWDRITQHLPDCARINPKTTSRFPLAHPIYHHRVAHPRIQFHSLHPPPFASIRKGLSLTEFYSGATRQSGRFSEGLLLRRFHPAEAETKCPLLETADTRNLT